MQVEVNIVYPINGSTFPNIDPGPGNLSSAYVPFSFSTTCPGGGHQVEWGVDNDSLGTAKFYDQFSSQFVWKLPGGRHTFWVRSSCGENRVEFQVGT